MATDEKRIQLLILVIFVIVFHPCFIDTKSVPDLFTQAGLHSYLKSYGFINEDTPVTEESNQKGLRKYQRFFDLPVTGFLDEATKVQMKKPRCGSPDVNAVSYSLAPMKYVAKHIRWKLNYTHEFIPYQEARKVVRESVQEWLKWMDVLTVAESKDTDSEIQINFVMPDIDGEHWDGIPFLEGEIGHAFYPDNSAIASDVHINMRSKFSPVDPPAEIEHSLKWTLTHELGHALGLRHSIHKTSVMYPIVPEGKAYPGLDQDDIYGIQDLYGACNTLPCKNGGTCITLARPPGAICVCPPTHTGYYCETQCQNSHKSNALCDLWAGKGECLVNPNWMEANCFKSCSKCHFPRCVNLHPDDKECTKWAKAGECKLYHKWMNTYCYKACSRCDLTRCPPQIIP